MFASAASLQSADLALAPRRVHSPARLILSALALAAIVASYSQPFWSLKLYAPQYPHGLSLTISLTGFSGDVREIDMLNHYIGMASLAHGAALEREYAHLLVGFVVLTIALFALQPARRGAAIAAVFGAASPLGFLADTFYWMYRFGHDLDPRAPLHIPHFTPQLFGNGNNGQFMTFAVPELGFGLAVVAAGLLLGAALIRPRQELACCAP
jgi:hypothetical protein